MRNHKTTYISWIVLIMLILSIYSCQINPCGSSPDDLIANMEDLVMEVKNKDYNPKDDRWKSYDDRFTIYFEDCFDRWSPDMTGKQKREFAGLITRYMANRFGRSFFRSIFGDSKVDEADTPEFFENLGEDLQKFLDENKKSGEEFFEDLMN